jgi:hypothetical protein
MGELFRKYKSSVLSTLTISMKKHNLARLLPVLFLVTGFYNCNKGPYGTTNKSYKKQAKNYAKIIRQAPLKDSISTGAWVGTTNFNMRKPNFVIIHHTAQNSCDQTLKTFTMPKTQVSAHYVICKDGTIHHMLNDYLRAWHGGVARWGNNTDINSSSIGIEIDNDGFEVFTDQQINSLLTLLASLKKAYGATPLRSRCLSVSVPCRRSASSVTTSGTHRRLFKPLKENMNKWTRTPH